MGYNGISECEDLEPNSVDIIFDKCKIGSVVLSNTRYSIHGGSLSVYAKCSNH